MIRGHKYKDNDKDKDTDKVPEKPNMRYIFEILMTCADVLIHCLCLFWND